MSISVLKQCDIASHHHVSPDTGIISIDEALIRPTTTAQGNAAALFSVILECSLSTPSQFAAPSDRGLQTKAFKSSLASFRRSTGRGLSRYRDGWRNTPASDHDGTA